jgi:chromosome segregation protein
LALQRADHEVENVTAGLQADLAREPVDLPPPVPPPPGLQGRVRALRGQLAAFGPVNARAPEDYAAARERQEFLQAQAHDLREGMARLRGLIAEANATVRERFGSVAAELDTQFRLYLQRLFGGGKGELTALYDEAGLPSGLEIAVQPPGKRTSELALLSGGERALVGLALVFAMLAVRPVPFCVLDEAEAALDEANTLRVGEILRALSARTQFIVITHNRGTMSHADALYGVTMAETGISQVASLRLDEVEAVRRSRAG